MNHDNASTNENVNAINDRKKNSANGDINGNTSTAKLNIQMKRVKLDLQ